MDIQAIFSVFVTLLELLGAGVITLGVFTASVVAGVNLVKRKKKKNIYNAFRRQIGRGILLGLELLIAADIIRTVAVRPDLLSVGALAAIVLIRTFLSFTLEVEMSGHWPWQKRSR